MKKTNQFPTKKEALILLQKYCAYQDRCHSEVRTKLLNYHVYGEDLEQVIADLIKDDFLNEERFARSYARGRFRIKSWGKVKIEQQLKLKKVSAYCIRKGLTEIEEEDYLETLLRLMHKKFDQLRGTNYERRQKTGKYLMQKGYESPIVWREVSRLKD